MKNLLGNAKALRALNVSFNSGFKIGDTLETLGAEEAVVLRDYALEDIANSKATCIKMKNDIVKGGSFLDLSKARITRATEDGKFVEIERVEFYADASKESSPFASASKMGVKMQFEVIK